MTKSPTLRSAFALLSCVIDRSLPALLSVPLVLASCSDSDGEPRDETPGTAPAVLVAAQIITPDDYVTYVAALPGVPEGHVSLAEFHELGNANVYTNAGYVFAEQDGVMTRFSVNDALELVENRARFSWTDFGIATANASYTVFASATRALTLAPGLGIIVDWDPQAMVRRGVIEVDLPARDGMETWAYDGHLVGDKIIWNVFSGNFETYTPYDAVTVVIADAVGDAPPLVVEDDRCLPGGASFVDANGDYYVQGGAYFGFFFAYGDVPDERTCLLRIPAGQTAFDPSYLVDYEDLLGSYVSDPWYHVSGDQFVVRSWDPAVAFPVNADEFYDNAALRPLLVDLSEGTVVPYPDLVGKIGIDGVTREVDGVEYYQISETGYVEGGSSEVVVLGADGIHPRFQLDGFLLGLERIR